MPSRKVVDHPEYFASRAGLFVALLMAGCGASGSREAAWQAKLSPVFEAAPEATSRPATPSEAATPTSRSAEAATSAPAAPTPLATTVPADMPASAPSAAPAAMATPAPSESPLAPVTRPAQEPTTAPLAAAPAVPATVPATRPATTPASQPALGSALRQRLQDDPARLRAVFDEQLYEMLQGRQVPKKQALAGLPVEDRRIIEALLNALQAFRGQSGPTEGSGAKVQPLLEMADGIRALAPLRIPTLALCTRVDGYGVYEPIEPRLPALREKGVVLYCEIEGFSSRLGNRRLWETRLSQEVLLCDEQGQVVWRDSSSTVDLSRHCRRDFFIARIIHFPGTLAAGKYVLQVTLTDPLSGKTAQAALPLQVAGEP